jgi:hypothetical protein
VLSYSTIGNLALIIRSVDKRFKGASLYVHVSGKLVKEINYDAPTMLPSGINTLEYSINKDSMTVERRHIGNARYSKHIYNERDEEVKFEAYEDKLIAYETFVYNDRGDLIDYAHYRPGNILAWRDVFRYEYDEAGNWTSREYTQIGERDIQFRDSMSMTTRTITYYSNQP